MIEDWSHLAPAGVRASFYASLDSTNSEGVRLIANGEKGVTPLWLIAGEQSSGRGRLGRVWSSESGNLFASVIVHPSWTSERMGFLAFAVSLAVYDAVEAILKSRDKSDASLLLKWPNDLLLNGKKLSGVLIERPGSNTPLVIGIGVNLTQAPQNPLYPATALALEGVTGVDVSEAWSLLAQSMQRQLSRMSRGEFGEILTGWKRKAAGFGERRLVSIKGEKVPAKMLSLESDGGLRVMLDDGVELVLYAGDVFEAPAE